MLTHCPVRRSPIHGDNVVLGGEGEAPVHNPADGRVRPVQQQAGAVERPLEVGVWYLLITCYGS